MIPADPPVIAAASERFGLRAARRSARAEAMGRTGLILGVFSIVLAWLTPFVVAVALVGLILATISAIWSPRERGVAWWGLGLNLAACAFCVVWAFWLMAQLRPVL